MIMKRRACQPRPDFATLVRDQGLVYHQNADGSPYWAEDACYVFTAQEIDRLDAAARELHQMFLAAAEHVLAQEDGLRELGIPPALHQAISRSWDEDQWEFYGRFDLTFDAGGVPRLIEYNADTPTGLLEASIVQWYWKEELFRHSDQFNAIHEGLVNRWKEMIAHGQITTGLTHFTSVDGHPEDRMTTGYIAATAEEAGLMTEHVAINRIGWDRDRREFVDEQNRTIHQLFKLYPWEWMGGEVFGTHLGVAKWKVLEPAWKAVFASKKLLLVLQELYPRHPSLLRVSTRPLPGDHVAKPAFGREGANVTLHRDGRVADFREGPFAGEEFIFQEYCPLVQLARRRFAQFGVWMAGPEPVGMSVREDMRPILGNTSSFVPHLIE